MVKKTIIEDIYFEVHPIGKSGQDNSKYNNCIFLFLQFVCYKI